MVLLSAQAPMYTDLVCPYPQWRKEVCFMGMSCEEDFEGVYKGLPDMESLSHNVNGLS
jgi:hypothetical protein